MNIVERPRTTIPSTAFWHVYYKRVYRRFQPNSFYYYDRPFGLVTRSTAQFKGLRATCDNFLYRRLELTNDPL